jgi:hypothetical protein
VTNAFSDRLEFSAKAIRKAIQTLQPVLGDVSVDAMIYDLELYGLLATNERASYSIDQIHMALERIFGSEATNLLIRRVKKALLEEIEKTRSA